jgi:hypothetical protein
MEFGCARIGEIGLGKVAKKKKKNWQNFGEKKFWTHL